MVKKQPKRRAWRKAKIEDVEEAMEDDRLISRMKRYDRPDALKGQDGTADASDLFTIDTKGSSEGLSAASRRDLARAKLFPPKGPNLGLSASEEAKVSRTEGSLGAAKKRPRGSQEPEVFDLWAAPDPAAAARQKARAEEEAAMTVIRRPVTAPSKVPKTLYQKVSAAPQVIPAPEGQSMNPTDQAYEDLACEAAARQLEQEAEADAVERRLRPITHELRELAGEEALQDMDEEAKMKLYYSLKGKPGGDEGAEGDGGGLPGAAEGKRKREQKSQAQRNRERKRRDLDARQAQKQASRALEKQVGEVGALLKEMRETSEFQRRRREYRAAHRAKALEDEAKGVSSRSHRLGRARFAEEALVVPDAAAASAGCMRSMPLKASAVKERLSSIVRRGLVPPPPVASKSEAKRHKSRVNKVRNSRKFISPLLRENLLLR